MTPYYITEANEALAPCCRCGDCWQPTGSYYVYNDDTNKYFKSLDEAILWMREQGAVEAEINGKRTAIV